jgi:membrane protease YdiL (CAAX protease family)
LTARFRDAGFSPPLPHHRGNRMHTSSLAFTTPRDAPRWQRLLVFSPIARIVFFAAMLVGFGLVVHALMALLGWNEKTATGLQRALATLSLQLLPALIAYGMLVKLIERRAMHELSPRSIPNLGLGWLATGALLFSIVVAVLWLLGVYHVTGINTQVNWLPQVLVTGIGAGIGEEIVTRGVIFRIVEEGRGTWFAVAVSALFFGGAHIFNPGATLWSSAAIAIEGGVMLALTYHVTRSLWACIGLHVGWNIMQGTVYGIPVSGGAVDGLLISQRSGPVWLSGGVFGAEASVIALLVCSVLSLILGIMAWRRGSIVPFWRPRVAIAASP